MDPGCCPAEAAAHQADADLCEQLACDPTLEACCQRDLEQQAMVSRLKAQLSLHNRSNERVRAVAAVLGTAPRPAPAPLQSSELGDEEEDQGEDQELMGAQKLLS